MTSRLFLWWSLIWRATAIHFIWSFLVAAFLPFYDPNPQITFYVQILLFFSYLFLFFCTSVIWATIITFISMIKRLRFMRILGLFATIAILVIFYLKVWNFNEFSLRGGAYLDILSYSVIFIVVYEWVIRRYKKAMMATGKFLPE